MRYVLVLIGFLAFVTAADPAAARDYGRHDGWRREQVERGDWRMARSDRGDRDRPRRMERDGDRGPPPSRNWRREDRPPLDRFLPNIRRQHPGRLLDVERGYGPRGEHNRIKWLTPDGRVIWLDTDARTGEIYGVEGDEPRRHRR